MQISQIDSKKMLPLLEELSKAIEDLLLTGLTTASESTTKTLNVSFQEASRMGLLRLGGTLRIACEELARFNRNQEQFSSKRLSFFLNRAWLLSKGLTKALRSNDDEEFARLSYTPAATPCPDLELALMGVVKKVVENTFCSFEFRLKDANSHNSYLWSCVFPSKPGVSIPPEAYLHLPQKQQFMPMIFLDGIVKIQNASMTAEKSGLPRLSFGDATTVSATGKHYEEWITAMAWDPQKSVERLKTLTPGPLDLEIEMQEEVLLANWQMTNTESSSEKTVFTITENNTIFEVVVPHKEEGKVLLTRLEELLTKDVKPPLFGLMHYESCHIVLQPLSIVTEKKIDYLTISKEKIDKATLVKSLKF